MVHAHPHDAPSAATGADSRQTETEGGLHNCAYNHATGNCTCICHGAVPLLWHSYEHWYVLHNGSLKAF